MQPSAPDDAALVAAARLGDLDAFEALVRAHTRTVYAHAVRFFGGDTAAADDVVQDVFVKVYRSIPEFDGRARFSTWLFRITRNVCLDQVRAGKRRPIPVDPLDAVPSATGDIADAAVLRASLETAIAGLPPEDRDALSAVAVFGLSYQEAAEQLGVPSGTVKSRVFRARRAVAAAIGIGSGGV